MKYKRPESVLVVLYCPTASKVLMLRRHDDPLFWQSVTGSLESDEQPYQTALREVLEETEIDIVAEGLTLHDAQRCVEFDIFPQFLHRYAPGTIRNSEHWFYLSLPEIRSVVLSEHSAYQWLPMAEAAALTKSWSNRQAIERLFNTNE